MKDHEIRELVNQLRDVAIKYHGAGQLREQIARTVRAAIVQAQTDDEGDPTDDERIMAIEGIHNCERCSDGGWVIGEMGITRCACGLADSSPVIPGAEQRIADAVELLKKAAPAMLADNGGPDGPLAGRLKSPVIPDGYVMVPIEPTEEMNKAGWAAMNEHDAINPTYRAMIAVATHDAPALDSVQSVVTVPGKWIPVSERLPASGGSEQRYVLAADFRNYYSPNTPNTQVGVYGDWFNDGNPTWDDGDGEDLHLKEVTHWMPLPAAPQEVK